MDYHNDHDALVATRDQLRAQLRASREQRETDEAAGAHLEFVLGQIAATRRDRDAGMSAELEQHRTEIDRAIIEAEDLVVAMARLWARVQVAELAPDDPRMRAAQRAVDEHFAHAMQTLADAVNTDETQESA